MVNKSKVKGTRWESQVVEYLKAHGFPFARRLTLAGSKDIGDIYLGDDPPGGQVTVEAKDCAAITLSTFMDETVAETENAGNEYGFVVVKRRNKPVGQAYVVSNLEMTVKDRLSRAAIDR